MGSLMKQRYGFFQGVWKNPGAPGKFHVNTQVTVVWFFQRYGKNPGAPGKFHGINPRLDPSHWFSTQSQQTIDLLYTHCAISVGAIKFLDKKGFPEH